MADIRNTHTRKKRQKEAQERAYEGTVKEMEKRDALKAKEGEFNKDNGPQYPML